MTKEQIDALEQLSMNVNVGMPRRHKFELNSARVQLNKLQDECDHKNPDGSSAIDETGMFMCVCTICGWNDM